MKKIILTALIFLCLNQAWSQVAIELTDTVINTLHIEKNSSIYIDSGEELPIATIITRPFLPLDSIIEQPGFYRTTAEKTFYVKFSIHNTKAAPVLYYYYPGKPYKQFQLFNIAPDGQLQKMVTSGLWSGFIPLQIPAGKTTSFLLQASQFYTSFNQVQSTLISPGHLPAFKNKMYRWMNEKKTAGILLSGMLLMMIIVTFLNYLVTKKIEFLYNCLYSLCMFFLIFLTAYLNAKPGWFRGFFITYFDLFLLIAGTIFYLAFTRHFLNSSTLHPKLNKFLYVEAWVLGILFIVYTVVHAGFNQPRVENFLENVLKIIALAAGLVYVFLSFNQKNTLMNYLATGAVSQVFFFIISLSLILAKADADAIYTSPFFYFELGVICSILFFLLGLFYKNNKELTIKIQEQEAMKLQGEKQSFENELAIYKAQQEERNRISEDMHDDLGAGMTAIRLYSELAKSKSGKNILPEIEKISSSSDELINKMNAIIWSMSSHNDTLDNMVSYIRSYTIEYLENTGVNPTIIIPESLPAIIVNGTIRRNVFLVIKEALQNIIKHAHATEVKIELKKEAMGFALTIHDNGIGIDFNNLRPFSNGLKNMKKRMKDVEIDFSIENNNGTLVRLYRKTR